MWFAKFSDQKQQKGTICWQAGQFVKLWFKDKKKY